MRLLRTVPLLLALLVLSAMPSSAQIVGVSIRVAPPPIPVYVQPPIPGPGYIWVPGYWAWDDDGNDYYWVPGTWVLAPVVGYLWTPGYWYWNDGFFLWRRGYWGPRVGFYGGLNYGCGYYGVGYVGGAWRGRVFAYNTAVTNIGTARIRNVYVDKTVIINKTTTNVSFHGGQGGTTVKPTAAEQLAEHDKHVPPSFMQRTHEHAASTNRALFAKVNDGKPTLATTPKAGQFSGKASFTTKDAKGPPRALTPNSSNTEPRTGDRWKGSGGPTAHTLNSSKSGDAGLNSPQGVNKEHRTNRLYTGKGGGPGPYGPGGPTGHPRLYSDKGLGRGGPYGPGGPNGPPRAMTTYGGPHPPQAQGGRPPQEGRRSPNYQGNRPEKGF